jgi:lysophospholipase L1-like esterase
MSPPSVSSVASPTPPPRSRRVRVLAVLLLNLVAIALLAGAAEIYLRSRDSYVIQQNADLVRSAGLVASDPEFLVMGVGAGRRMMPNAHVIIKNHRLSGKDILVDTDSNGFRDHELPVARPAGELRVLGLGDSITVGDYLPVEQVWVERAEQLLAARLGRPVEVINAGLDDIGLREELDILEERGLSQKPDWVVVGFYLNDGRPPWGFAGELGSYGFIRRHSVLAQKIYEQLALLKLVRERGDYRMTWLEAPGQLPWQSQPELLRQLIKQAEYDWGSAWGEGVWPVIDGQLDRLQRLSQVHHFHVLIVCFPVRYQVYTDYVEDTPQRKMKDRAAARGFDYLDLLPVLRNYRGSDDLFFDQCHPQAFTNQVIGQAVADALLLRISPH